MVEVLCAEDVFYQTRDTFSKLLKMLYTIDEREIDIEIAPKEEDVFPRLAITFQNTESYITQTDCCVMDAVTDNVIRINIQDILKIEETEDDFAIHTQTYTLLVRHWLGESNETITDCSGHAE